MTSPRRTRPPSSDRLAALLRPSLTRRDAVRAGAILAAAGSMGSAGAWSPYPLAAQDDIETDVELAIPLDPFGQGISLDPHRATDLGAHWVMLPYVWSGLLAFDENGAVVNDLAESFEPGEDAATWTATLRDGLAFASGTVITAQHVVDSWLRALNPASVAPMATFMSAVEGFDAYVAGESAEIGFTVVDERTIEIRLSEPDATFPSQAATFVWAVVDLEQVEADPSGFPLADAGAGQWRFTAFDDRTEIVMEQNPAYWDGGSPSISRIRWPFMDSVTAAADGLVMYQADEIVSLDVPLSLVPTIEAEEALAADLVTIEPEGSTLAIGMDFTQPPFDDVRIRQAVARAVDTTAWATETWAGSFVPAASFTPPVTARVATYEPPAPLGFDAEAAGQLVADAGFETGDAQAEITYYQPATDSAEDVQRHADLLAMIEANSGIRITHDTTRTREQIAALQTDLGGRQFDLVWWWPVSATPDLLGTVGHSSSPYMAGWFNWSPELEGAAGEASSAFDEQIAAARAALDPETRNAAYSEAERILLENAVYVPLGHWVQRYVQKPWLQGTRQGAWSGRIPVRIDRNVTVTGRQQ